MKKGMKFSLATAGVLLIGGTAVADVTLFDISRNGREAWEAALGAGNKEVKSTFDLTAQFGDPGIAGLDGPVGLGDSDKTVDSNLDPFGSNGPNGRGAGGTGLVLIGASAGFGNAGTSLAANYFVDSFDIMMNDEINTAAEFDAASLLGTNTVTISVYDTAGGLMGQFSNVSAGAAGNTYGVISDDVIGRINIYDEGGGAEGITGSGAFYQAIPAPGALALLGVAGLVSRRRRR